MNESEFQSKIHEAQSIIDAAILANRQELLALYRRQALTDRIFKVFAVVMFSAIGAMFICALLAVAS